MADDDEAPPPPPPPTRDPPKRKRLLPSLPPLGTFLRVRSDRRLAGPPPPPPCHPLGPPPPKRQRLLPPLGTFLRDRPDRLLTGSPPDPRHPMGPPPPRTTGPPVRISLRALPPLPHLDIPPLPHLNISLRALTDRLLAGPPPGTGPLVRISLRALPPLPSLDTSLRAPTDRLLAGPPPGPRHPLDPPPPGTGPRVRISCRRFPPPQVTPSMGTSSSPLSVEASSDDPAVSAAAMLANIERSIWLAGKEAAAAAATAPPARELELPVLAISDSCLSIQQHLKSSQTSAEDTNSLKSSQTSAEDTNSDPAADVNTTGDPALSGQSQAKLPSKGYSSLCSSRMQGSSDDSMVSAAARPSLAAIECSIRSVGAVAVAAEAGEPELPSSVPSDSCLPTQHHLSSSSSSWTSAGDTKSDPAADVNTDDPLVSGQSSGSNESCSDEEDK